MATLAIVTASSLAAAPPPLFTLIDPAGDDAGDGALVYPSRGDWSPGDLDLVSLAAFAEKGGTRFEATFARTIRVADRRPVDAAGTTLDRLARFGLYTLNLDLYLDLDRVPGSGRTAMLPGRRAEVDSATAWERAILVTPRPYEARAALVSLRLSAARDSLQRSRPRVDQEDLDRLEREIASEIDSTVFFATRISIAGRTLRFFVPAAFLGGPVSSDWAYLVAVSAADLTQRVKLDVRALASADFAEGLMILPVGPGRPDDRLGGGREQDDLQPPLMDVLIARGRTQSEALKDYDRLSGRPVRLLSVVPAEIAK